MAVGYPVDLNVFLTVAGYRIDANWGVRMEFHVCALS